MLSSNHYLFIVVASFLWFAAQDEQW